MIADSGARMVVADPDTVGHRARRPSSWSRGRWPATRPRSSRTCSRGRRAPRRRRRRDRRCRVRRTCDDLSRRPGRAACPPLQDPEALAVLLYTSGTSGRPRAAMLTHRALLANIEQVAQVDPPMIHGDDVVLGVLPLFHVYGLNAVLGQVLRHRAQAGARRRLRPQGTLDLIEDEAISVVPGGAAGLRALAGRCTGSRSGSGPVRLMLSRLGAAVARADRALHRAHRDRRSTRATASPRPRRWSPSTLCSTQLQPGSVGAALPGIEIRLVDEAGADARGRGRRRDPDLAATTCSAATGPTAPAARTATAGGPPATSASSTRPATCSSSTGSRSW